MNAGSRVLVTGASGFVGRALVDTLLAKGYQVTAAVRRDPVFPAAVRVTRVADLGPETDWTEALDGCGAVVHLAARVHQDQDQDPDPGPDSLAASRRVNLTGTLALARQAAARGAGRMVFVSTIKVNGESTQPGRPFRETDSPAPVDPYGISKAEAEAALFELADENTGMEVAVIRPPLVYGPGVKANFRSMLKWLSRGVPLPLGAVHDNRRSLVGLQNLVSLIESCLVHPAARGQVFLAGDGEDLSTTELLRRTAAALGVIPRLIPVPVPVLQAVGRLAGKRPLLQRLCGSLQADVTKARHLLDWRPASTMTDELARTAAAFRAESRS